MSISHQINDLLTRGIANIIPSKDKLETLLKSDKKLNIYLGIDPTSVHIHLGHATHLHRLQTLAELGHNVIFLIGDFTALVGDTSDKDKERPILSSEEIEANWQTYKSQAKKIIDFSQVKIHRNSEWLDKLSTREFLKIMYQFSLNDFISRELIKNRLEAGGSVRLPESIYPVMQGYDSYFMDTDIQLGGTDQTFNMQAGRVLQKNLRDKESFVLVGEFLTGTDGRKMSKSWGNAIWLDDSPSDVYGKVMSIKDDLIIEYFTLATNLPLSEISKITGVPNSPLERGPRPQARRGVLNPMETKKRLAYQITLELHDESAADSAQSEFERIHQQGSTPTDIPEFETVKSEWNPVDLLTETKLSDSKSAARRLIEQGGLQIDNQNVSDWKKTVTIKNQSIIQAGKRKFIKIVNK